MQIFKSGLGIQKRIPLCLFFLVIVISCGKDPSPRVQFDTPQLSLHYDQQHQYTLREGSTEIDPKMFAWTCDDPSVGTVDAQGNFKARKVGKTIVKAISSDGKTKLEANVTIIPYSTLFTKPVAVWGETQSGIRMNEKRKILEAGAYHLAYSGETPNVLKAEYNFTTEQRLNNANIHLKNDPQTYQEAVLFLKERYPDYYSANNTTAPFQLIHSFFNEDRTTQIHFSKTEIGNLVSYFESVQ